MRARARTDVYIRRKNFDLPSNEFDKPSTMHDWRIVRRAQNATTNGLTTKTYDSGVQIYLF